MAEKLFQTVNIPSLSKAKKNISIRYKRSLAWDMEKGDFVRDSTGKILEDTGRDAYIAWCVKTSTTERYTKAAYPDSIGSELEKARKEVSNEAVELAVERTLREAIMVNPRTESVYDFSFEWDGDDLSTTFTVKGKNIDEFQITV